MTDDAGLFGVEELRFDPERRGRAEAGLMRALAEAETLGRIAPEDSGMIGAALVAARALDQAERHGGPKTPYAIQAAMPSYMEALYALRLPVKTAPIPPPLPAVSQPDPSDWLGDAFGSAE